MLGVALCGAPVLLVDGFVLIPSLMMFMAAIGPLNALVAKTPTCVQCGAPTEKLRTLRLISSQPASKSTRRSERRRGPRSQA
jgi:hypothetical protein